MIRLLQYWWKQDWTMCAAHIVHSCQQCWPILLHLIQAQQYCSILLTTVNNVGRTSKGNTWCNWSLKSPMGSELNHNQHSTSPVQILGRMSQRNMFSKFTLCLFVASRDTILQHTMLQFVIWPWRLWSWWGRVTPEARISNYAKAWPSCTTVC
jgi:hypothetical protein